MRRGVRRLERRNERGVLLNGDVSFVFLAEVVELRSRTDCRSERRVERRPEAGVFALLEDVTGDEVSPPVDERSRERLSKSNNTNG